MRAGEGAGAVRTVGHRGSAVVVAVGAGLAVLLAVVDPSRPGFYPVCPIRALTGLYCPGCGGLRAVHALTHGDLLTALHQNALLVIGAPFLVAVYSGWVRSRRDRRQDAAADPLSWVGYRVAGVALGLVTAFGFLRNLPGLAVLAP